MKSPETLDPGTLRRSRRRWRIATAGVTVVGFWLLASAGATIQEEQARVASQAEQIARLEEQLAVAARELETTTSILSRSRDVIQLFGKKIATQAAETGELQVSRTSGSGATN